jgi:hypothetical protein
MIAVHEMGLKAWTRSSPSTTDGPRVFCRRGLSPPTGSCASQPSDALARSFARTPPIGTRATADCDRGTLSPGWPGAGRLLLLLQRGTIRKVTAETRSPRVRRSVHVFSDTATDSRLVRAMSGGRARSRPIPPDAALPLVNAAGGWPDNHARSRSCWDGHELVRQPLAEAVVPGISIDIVRRRLQHHPLKPRRVHDRAVPQTLSG